MMCRSRTWTRGCLPVVAAHTLLASVGLAQSVTMEVIPRFFARAVSADGSTVVGYAPHGAAYAAAYWTERSGVVIIEPSPVGSVTFNAHAVSADGSVIVGIEDQGPVTRAFRWTEATGTQQLPLIPRFAGDPTASSYAHDITPDGRTAIGMCGHVGFGTDLRVSFWDGTEARETDHTWEGIGISADGTVVAGSTGGVEAWAWRTEEPEPTLLGRVPGAATNYTRAWALSEDGSTIIGAFEAPAGGGTVSRGFVWREGVGLLNLGTPAPGMDGATVGLGGVSGDGSVVVGFVKEPTKEQAPVIWDEANGLRAFTDVLRMEHGFDPGPVRMLTLEAISPDGRTLAGNGRILAEPVTFVLHFKDGACVADCDSSGSLDFFDFLCFQNLFAAGGPEADCDDNGDLDFFDFLCFQNQFASGCP